MNHIGFATRKIEGIKLMDICIFKTNVFLQSFYRLLYISLKKEKIIMDNPLSSLLNISMENLKRLVDVNTIVGSPIISGEATIIPVSKVKLGFFKWRK
ncbi:MAG: hypothetical protein L6U99_01810 [Clostridium sp.]|nr:MAG: hypothetical protein L6U99_01810 [Clostridium sp.]